ncbi:MAG TPA: hypothetical protein VGK93_05905 [Candidatus Eisenbacteria bacterium]|jgi:hypothetical protein
MRDVTRDSGHRKRILWLAGLGACTLWLVVQNTLLLLALWWVEPGIMRAVAIGLMKAGAVVAAKLWVLPWVSAVAGGIVVAVWRDREAIPARREVRHG